METTVTGMFPDQQTASLAAASLVRAGYASERVRIVNSHTSDRHQFIQAKTSDAKRAVILGVVFGSMLGSLAGAALAGVLDIAQAAAIGCLAGAAGGAVLGLAVGRSTKSQVQDELEHQVDAGTVLVSVITDEAGGLTALQLLTQDGGTSIVSTAATFTAAVLPSSKGP